MRVLFAILLLAVAGLLWATIAASQHIRRARRRWRGSAAGSQRSATAAAQQDGATAKAGVPFTNRTMRIL